MPLDAGGNYRHNHESAAMHSKVAGKEYKPGGEKPEEGGDHVEIHSHGDGTFHTMHQGEKMDHETHGHALIHAAKIHAEPGHAHFHSHLAGEEQHTHSVKDGEEPESRENQDADGARSHMDEAMGGEGPEQEDAQHEPAGAGLGGLY